MSGRHKLLELVYIYNKPVGIVVRANSSIVYPTNKIQIVLHKGFYNEKPYYILTAYPIMCDQMMSNVIDIEDKYPIIRLYFIVFFGQDADEYGETYPEIVKNSGYIWGGYDNGLSREIDAFLAEFPDNDRAIPAMNDILGAMFDAAKFPPTLIEFLAWLSACIKELSRNENA